ncbi:MAG: N-acetylmuramoyl-L-alanine amidase [Acidobacteria bacterium]|nr:N-acetylmuramoyl-L-alanine amidase [Acidobacteriota bacterium]MBV9477748.1 N-acetylmuramoyl-L-alanine amidase [Acidobacteriota bacterium]
MNNELGMRREGNERLKRRVLQEAVTENLDVMRGLPPRAVRPARRAGRIWLRRAPFFLVPLTLAGSTYLARQTAPTSKTPQPRLAAAAAVTATPSFVRRPAPATDTAADVERVTSAAFPLAVRRIVLDAGHGGADPGAATPTLSEKTITLDIGNRLRALLERDGFTVVETRSDDRMIPLRERARLANDSQSDIFVSIHVNSIVKHTASRGVETYYLGPTNDPSLTELAAAENRVSGYSIADMRKLLDGVYADARRDESHELAASVQQELFGTLRNLDPKLENWGVKRAPFLVLVATGMPAILAEVGCLSNEQEAAMLSQAEYRQKIAGALFHGIRAYASANDAPQQKGSEHHG